jgi:hypothetical protein
MYPTCLTHGAEPFLRSCQLRSYSRNSQHFMEHEGSLPCPQVPSTGPDPETAKAIHTISSYVSKIYFHIVNPPTSRYSQWSLTLWLSHQYPICISLLPHSCYMPCPSNPPCLGSFQLYLEKSTSYEAIPYIFGYKLSTTSSLIGIIRV